MSNFDKKIKRDFMEYATEVIEDRAIPKIEDGFKPIHRRVLYAMHDMKLVPSKPHVKSAKVVGEVMSRLHPHGDSSIYETAVRLSQWWKMRYPLIEMHGNNGAITGDSAAASRYTEIRLSPLGMLMCEGLNKNIVPTQLNYSGEEYEPILLPSAFPNVLVNPNLGIAVAMACNTYPHNLTEMCAALCDMINNENYTIKDFLQKVKGPDFPTGGIVLNGEDLEEIYSSGRGSVKVQSKYHLENLKGETHIVITEIPYLTTIDKFTGPISAMMEEDNPYFKDIQDNIGNKGFELRIILNKGVDVKKAIEVLRKETGFESSLKFNNTLLVNGKPQQLNILETMQLYINHRHKMIISEAAKDKANAEERLEIVEGLLIAIQDIDGVVAIIKTALNRDDARTKLIAKYGLKLIQANAILDMKLSRLTSLDTKKLVDEKQELISTIAKCAEIIENKALRNKMIVDSLTSISQKFGDSRRTEIKINTENVEVETIAEPKVYYLYDDGISSEKQDRRYKTQITARQKKEISCYNEKGEFFPDGDGKGMFLNNKDFIVCVTKNGKVKLTKTSEYIFNKKQKGIKLAEGDILHYAAGVNINEYILILTTTGLLKVKVSDFNATGKLTQGVKVCEPSDFVDAVAAADGDMLLMSSSDTKAKLTPVVDLTACSKGNKGNSVAEDTVRIINVTNRESVLLVAKAGKDVEFNLDKLSIKGKNAKGAKMSAKIIEEIR